MDETTKQALNAFVQQTITAAQDSAKWTADQAPLVVQEWLRWQLTEAALVALALLLAAISLFVLAKRLTPDGDWEEYFPLNLFALCGGIALLMPFGANVLIAAKVLVAPRVVVLEKFISLLK